MNTFAKVIQNLFISNLQNLKIKCFLFYLFLKSIEMMPILNNIFILCQLSSAGRAFHS